MIDKNADMFAFDSKEKSDFDKKVEEKFGTHMLNQIN
jgi:hypothetical protein